MDSKPERKPWAVLAYTVADDKGGGDSLDAAARRSSSRSATPPISAR